MEPVLGACLGDEWDALCKMFTSEDSDLLLQLNGDYDQDLPSNESNPNLCFQNQSLFFPINEGNQNVGNLDGNFQGFNVLEYLNFHNVSQENSYSSESGSQSQSQSPYLHYESNQIHEFCELIKEPNHGLIMDESNANMVASFLDDGMMISPREDVGSEKLGNADGQQSSIEDSGNRHILKRKLDNAEVPIADDKCITPAPEIPTKKSRASRNAQKSKAKAQSKPKSSVIKGKQISNVDEEETNGVQIVEVFSHSNSEDNNSNESNGGSTSDSKEVTMNGKTRASRGSATDPQSLYARRRRERINERLRILQNLIPNGTKVDISTMLEEAVHYVKFMQLQIKLLSSEDMWMYAPIVYNGIDVGMYHKNFPTL